MAAGMSIGRLSRETGVKATTIRFYEEIGLLPSPLRSDSNRRLYQQEDVSRLRLIRHARDLGFEAIAQNRAVVMTVLAFWAAWKLTARLVPTLSKPYKITTVSQQMVAWMDLQRLSRLCRTRLASTSVRLALRET